MTFRLSPLQLRSLSCYSFAPYPPKSAHNGSQEDWDWWWIVQAFKRGKLNYKVPNTNQWVEAGALVAATIDAACLADLTGRTLIPVPGHRVTPGSLDPMTWPSLRMAMALAGRSGCGVAIALRRVQEIQQSSATASLADRATVDDQVASLSVSLEQVGDRALLVDDTLTSGTTCMGAFEALRRAGYAGDVRAFTIGHVIGVGDSRDFHRRTTIQWLVGHPHASRS